MKIFRLAKNFEKFFEPENKMKVQIQNQKHFKFLTEFWSKVSPQFQPTFGRFSNQKFIKKRLHFSSHLRSDAQPICDSKSEQNRFGISFQSKGDFAQKFKHKIEFKCAQKSAHTKNNFGAKIYWYFSRNCWRFSYTFSVILHFLHKNIFQSQITRIIKAYGESERVSPLSKGKIYLMRRLVF
jgi:hypothetical protein